MQTRGRGNIHYYYAFRNRLWKHIHYCYAFRSYCRRDINCCQTFRNRFLKHIHYCDALRNCCQWQIHCCYVFWNYWIHNIPLTWRGNTASKNGITDNTAAGELDSTDIVQAGGSNELHFWLLCTRIFYKQGKLPGKKGIFIRLFVFFGAAKIHK